MSDKYIKTPKKYNYTTEYYDNNLALNFIEKQQSNLNRLDVSSLYKYIDILIKKDNNVNCSIVVNDIKQFENELKRARTQLDYIHYRLSKGVKGENKIQDIISSYTPKCKFLHDVTLNVNNNKIENDFIVITPTGIITFEVKNIGRTTDELFIDELGRVNRIDLYGNTVESFDMIAQNNRHQALLELLIEDNFDYPIEINSAVIIANNIKVTNQSEFYVLGTNQVYRYLKKNSSIKKLSEEQINCIYDFILENSIENYQYPYINYSKELEKNYNLILKALWELAN